uniref:fibroblast growth factor 6-like isoform X2 n=1 Tax=Doryrhamphus excisus TaxID=161450 RepID=UPI0025AE930F|nr:fibroblast growth factor 6-like isoform X2 [Doryrhamphus excisus]
MAGARRLLVSMSQRTLTAAAVLLCGLLLGWVSAHPPLPGGRTNATLLLEKRWETLFSRSVLGISGEKPELNWESDYLLGIKRVRRLYCNVGIGFHLRILPDGRIDGVHHENQYSPRKWRRKKCVRVHVHVRADVKDAEQKSPVTSRCAEKWARLHPWRCRETTQQHNNTITTQCMYAKI